MTSDGDYIGTESSINDLVSHNESPNTACTSIGAARQYSFRKKKEKKEFPPPLPLLARTESLSSHMPWELKRYYTSDGRLILREERVRHHDYFKAHRENGRLILQLIPLEHIFHEVEPEPTSPPRTDDFDDDDDDDDDESYRDRSDPLSPGRFRGEQWDWNLPPKVPGNGATKCKMNFTRVASAPCCLFEMPLHAVRTVHG